MQDKLRQDLKDAMRAKDEVRKNTIRMLMSAFKNAQIEKGGELSEADSLTVLAREAKKRREASTSFRDGGRDEAADLEDAELEVIEGYLPKQMSEDEVRKIAASVVDAVKPSGPRDMGKVMGQVMPKIKGRFDGKRASAIIRELVNAALEA